MIKNYIMSIFFKKQTHAQDRGNDVLTEKHITNSIKKLR